MFRHNVLIVLSMREQCLSRVSSIISGLPGIIENVELSRIRHNYYEVRSDFQDIAELSASINRHGLFHPIILRTKGQDYFEIVAGNRRFDACKALGWRKIACHIMDLVDKDAFEIALIENIQRKNLQPLDEAARI